MGMDRAEWSVRIHTCKPTSLELWHNWTIDWLIAVICQVAVGIPTVAVVGFTIFSVSMLSIIIQATVTESLDGRKNEISMPACMILCLSDKLLQIW